MSIITTLSTFSPPYPRFYYFIHLFTTLSTFLLLYPRFNYFIHLFTTLSTLLLLYLPFCFINVFTTMSTRITESFIIIFLHSSKLTNFNQSLTLIILPPFFIPPPLVFDSEIPNRRPVGPRLRGPTASVHISTSACHIVVNV